MKRVSISLIVVLAAGAAALLGLVSFTFALGPDIADAWSGRKVDVRLPGDLVTWLQMGAVLFSPAVIVVLVGGKWKPNPRKLRIAAGWIVAAWAILPLATLFILSDFRLKQARRPKPEFHSRGTVRVTQADGKVIEGSTDWKNRHGREGLQQMLGNVTGNIVMTTSVMDDPPTSLKYVGLIRNGRLQGLLRCYLVLGKNELLTSTSEYVDDLKHGPTRAYYPGSDHLQIECSFVKGKREGEALFHYANGAIGAKMTYRDDSLEGPCTVYDSAAKVIVSGEYKDDRPFNGTFVDDVRRFTADAAMGYASYARISRFTNGVRVEGPTETKVEIHNKLPVDTLQFEKLMN